ncbi:MAG: AbgT family transporter [Candidatus Brocadiae bacterium]|nr:AbgT family transporter [Candidatus Brocadiia bacterium]
MKHLFSLIASFGSKAFSKSLDKIERVGNALPHPATLFAMLALAVALLSAICAWGSVSAVHPVSKATIESRNLLNLDGLRWIYTNVLKNFLDFPPLGYVLVVMIGIGVAEGSGLFTLMIRALVLTAPQKWITGAVVLAGVISHLASEGGYVILIPLGAAIFHALGRHPMAGLAAAFCGVSGGFGSNLLITSVDTMLCGMTETAARMILPGMTITPAVNFYFLFVSAILVVVVGTWVTEKIVIPRLGAYQGTAERLPVEKLSAIEKKGLLGASIALLIAFALLAFSIIPENGILRNPQTKSALHSPFFDGIIVGILLIFFVPGIVYGIIVKSIKSDKDVVTHITNSMKGIAGYIVLVFFASQFVAFFNYSKLGIILAIKGAAFLQSIQLTGIPLVISFVLLSAFINLFMGSASAKWAIMAPVFVPMFMLIDPAYHPALTQAAFRIGDSITNVITPMMSYFALIVAFSQRYDEKYGIGTIISTMIPYTIFLGIFWTLLLIIWVQTGYPLGPDAPIFLTK